VPKDYVLAYMWSTLAASQGDQAAVVVRDDVAKKMTAEQIAQAQALASRWHATTVDQTPSMGALPKDDDPFADMPPLAGAGASQGTPPAKNMFDDIDPQSGASANPRQ
jgi:hypothetical protein